MEGFSAPPSDDPPIVRLHAASLVCDNCARETPHRLLRIDPRARDSRSQTSGVARCRVCGWTHRFEIRLVSEVAVGEVISEGPTSVHRTVHLPSGQRLRVGSAVPGSSEPLKIVRIDDRQGRRVPSASSDEVATLWVRPDRFPAVPVSIVEGRRTRSTRVPMDPEAPIVVGAELQVEGVRVRIDSVRARGASWRRLGDAFSAREVQRVYGRRAVKPPAGRSDWSSERGIPSSRASSASRSGRSRSGPGVKRRRTTPRARTAASGAIVQRVSPS